MSRPAPFLFIIVIKYVIGCDIDLQVIRQWLRDPHIEEPIIVRFTFSNPGVTLSSDQIEKVFEPFYSGDRTFKEEGSVGLGLSIVKAIVDDHKGTIRMESSEGRTIVIVELPATEKGAIDREG